MDLNELRTQYEVAGIDVESLADDPIVQLEQWLDAAIAAELPEPNAMTLSTVDAGGVDARVVLLKGLDDRGLAFYTNLESAKAHQLRSVPMAAITFLWQPLHRQVRVRGTVHLVEDDEADAYYATRPPDSQIGAWVSPQSRPIPDRAVLEQAFEETRRRFGDGQPPRPPHWGGYRVSPTIVEFWQGQPSRLHDRVQYRQVDDGWVKQRLAP